MLPRRSVLSASPDSAEPARRASQFATEVLGSAEKRAACVAALARFAADSTTPAPVIEFARSRLPPALQAEADARLYLRNKRGLDLPLTLSSFMSGTVGGGAADSVSSVLENADPRTSLRRPIHDAAADGDATAVLFLMMLGASTDALTASGYTPLYLAAWHGRIDCVKALLQVKTMQHTSDVACALAVHATGDKGLTAYQTAHALAGEGDDPRLANWREIAALLRPISQL